MRICKAFSVSTMQIHCLQIGIPSITVSCASLITGWVHFYCLLFGGQFIETEGMRDILQQYRIQSFQGYYYGKPLELRDFLVWKPVKALPGDIAP